MMNLNQNIVTDTNDQSLNMPSHPTSLTNEAIYYFVESRRVEDKNVGNIKEVEGDSANETQVEVDHHIQQGTTPVLKKFLRLPMERVTKKATIGSQEVLSLSQSSQLLTSNEYMTLLAEAGQKKKEIQELKEKKKDHANERRAERSIQAEQRKQLRMEREKERQENNTKKYWLGRKKNKERNKRESKGRMGGWRSSRGLQMRLIKGGWCPTLGSNCR